MRNDDENEIAEDEAEADGTPPIVDGGTSEADGAVEIVDAGTSEETGEKGSKRKISLPAIRDYATMWLRKIVPSELSEEGHAEVPAWVSWTKDRFFPEDVITQDDDRVFMNTSGVIRKGHLIMGVFVIGAFLWAALVPLDSAIIARGEVVVQTHRKTIQHLEGGIVREIKVVDGQSVKAGQVLILLEDTQARANLGVLQGEVDALTAQEARLSAERDGKDHVQYPPELEARRTDPNVAEAIRGEDNAFASRKAALEQQVGVLGQRSSENQRMIAGLKNQREAVRSEEDLIQQEVTSVEGLYKQGLATLPRLLALQRQAADLHGQEGQISEKIAQVELSSGENAIEITHARQEQLSQVVQDLREVQTKKYEAMDRLHAAEDTLKHTVLKAPVAGAIVGLTVHTIGQVIKPGETVMEIVPENDRLDVEAQLRPEDADDVYPGMTARINFSAYKQRSLPLILGRVETVSADKLVDQRTGQPYFSVDVSVDSNVLKQYPAARVIPGLPVEVEIATGSRTTLQYLASPMTRAFRHGMREK